MFLHIGSNVQVPIKNIITILDINILKSKYNKEFLDNVDKIVYTSCQDPKALILTKNNSKNNTVYFSPISSYTLKKRL